MSSKIYSYSYSNINGKVKEEEIHIEDGKGKITKKEDGDIIEDEDITMKELEEYMKEKNIDLHITPEILEDAVDMLNQLLKSKQGRKNLEELQKLDLLDLEEDEIEEDEIEEDEIEEEENNEEDTETNIPSELPLEDEEIINEENEVDEEEIPLEELQQADTISDAEKEHCEKILKVFGIEGTKPSKDEFLKVYNKLYNAYLQECKGIKTKETEECKAKLAKLDSDFESYSEPYNCWDN